MSVSYTHLDVYKRQLEGCPVTIRFLDPPLHEFVPTEEDDIKKLAEAQGLSLIHILLFGTGGLLW